MATAEGRKGEGRGLIGDPDHTQMINKLTDAVMKKLANSDPSKTLTLDQKNDIERHLCRLLPVFHMPNHPTYAVMIRKAIEELNEEHGSSEEAISKFIRGKFNGLPWAHARFLSLHLKKLNERGEIFCISNNCYMLPAEENNSLPRRERVPKKKRTQKVRERRTLAGGIELKKLAEEQVEVTEKQRVHGQQSQELQYANAIDGQTGSLEQDVQDQVNGRKCQRNKENIAATAEKESQEPIEEDQCSKVIDDQNGFPDERQGEVIGQQIQDIAVIAVHQNSIVQKYKVPEEQVKVTEQQHWKQSQELIQEEQPSMVIDCRNGSPDEENVQQDEKSQNVQLTRVIVEKQNIEQHSMVIACQNGSPDEENVQQGGVNRPKSQNQVQVPGVIVEKQNIEQTYKVDEERVEVSEQLREDGQEIQEQCSKMIEDENGSTDEQQDRVSGHEIHKEMQEIALIFEKPNFEVKKYQVNGEKVEVIEQQTERGKQSQEPIQEGQHRKVIDYQNGSSKKQIEQKDEVNGQESQNQMKVSAVVVEKHNIDEQTCKVTEEQQVEVTEQQRGYGQQSQEEQNGKVIHSQNGSPEKKNKQQDDMNGYQMQEILVACEKQIYTKQKYKAAEEQIEASVDEIIEEQCQAKEQQCEVIEQHIQGVKRDIQFQEEVVEAIEKMTRPEAHESDIISEQNRLQEQIKLRWKIVNSGITQELMSKKQEKDAAAVVNSNDSITSQKLPHHVLSNLSKGNCIELMMMTRKLLENNVKVQEKTLRLQEKLFERLMEFRDTNPNPIIEERPMPITGPCGERESTDCGFPAQQKPQPDISVQRKALESQLNELSASLELPTDVTELFPKQGKISNLGQQQIPKCLNISFKTFADAEHPQQQEIGSSEHLWELSTTEADNGELSGPVRKKIRLSLEASHDKEKELQVHNDEGHPGQEKLSVSLPVPSHQDVSIHSPKHDLEIQQPNVQKPEKPQDAKSLSVKGGITAVVSRTNLIKSSVDLLQEVQEVDPELTIRENLQEREQEMQSSSQEKQRQAIRSDVVKTPACQVATEAENVIKEKAVELEFTESDQSCQRLTEQMPQRQPGPPGKQPSESYGEVAKASKCQDEEPQAENVIKGKAVELELTASEQSCQRQPEKQEQQPQWQLRSRGIKLSESDCGVETEPKCQGQQTKDPLQERRKLDHKPGEQRQLRSRSQRQSKCELFLTSMAESPPRRNWDTQQINLQETEKTRELKTSAEETGQALLQQRQLRPRGKNLSESKQATTKSMAGSSTSQPLHQQYALLSNTGGSQVEKPGVEDSSQLKKKQVNRFYQRKRCTPEPSPKAFQDLGPAITDHLSQHMEQNTNHHGRQKKFKSKPRARESTDELALITQQLVVEPQTPVESLLLNPAAVEHLPQTMKVPLQKQQQLRHMKLRSCSQAASQSEPDVPIIESLPSQHHCEQPQEQNHCEQPKKRRGRPPKPKLDGTASGDVSLPSKRQKLQEQPERRGRPPKLDVNIISGRKLISKNRQKQPKSPGGAKPQKVTKGKPQSQVRGRPSKVTEETPRSQVRARPRKVTEGTLKSQVRVRARKVIEGTPKSQRRGKARKVTKGTPKSNVRGRARKVTEGT